MKKIKLGNLDIFSLEERDLKNVFGGMASVSTVYTSSSGGTTKSIGNVDADSEGVGDADGTQPTSFKNDDLNF